MEQFVRSFSCTLVTDQPQILYYFSIVNENNLFKLENICISGILISGAFMKNKVIQRPFPMPHSYMYLKCKHLIEDEIKSNFVDEITHKKSTFSACP